MILPMHNIVSSSKNFDLVGLTEKKAAIKKHLKLRTQFWVLEKKVEPLRSQKTFVLEIYVYWVWTHDEFLHALPKTTNQKGR